MLRPPNRRAAADSSLQTCGVDVIWKIGSRKMVGSESKRSDPTTVVSDEPHQATRTGSVRASSSDLVRNLLELGVRFATEGSDRAHADNDDQSHHDGVLNSSWSVFFFQKVLDAFGDVFHLINISREC